MIYGFVTATVQVMIISATFGQIMDSESLYGGSSMAAMLIWPGVLFGAGLIVALLSRVLARQVLRGLGESSSSS